MTRLAVVLSVVLVFMASINPVQSVCGPRIRREWRQLSAADKALYRDAITAAMSSGYHTLFQEVLSDRDTCNEVYLTSATVYWHRRFLLAYENMLRSLEPRFACLTIPYWDMFADSANQVSLVCTTMEQCSQFLSEFGGSNGSRVNVAINGLNISTANPDGNCVSGGGYADFSPFCQNSASNASCSGCVPRGPWNELFLPSSLTYTELAKLIRPSYGFTYFASTLQTGIQSSMHNALNATMATCATAADPIFYSLQATFDLVHQMFYDCQIGRNLTTAEKQATSSRFVYQQYALAPGVPVPTVMSNMTMYWNSTLTGQRMRVEDHPRLRQFFEPLVNQFWFYASAADLGANSYAYAADTLISLLQLAGVTLCPQNKKRLLQDIVDTEVSGTVQPGSGDAMPLSESISSSPLATTLAPSAGDIKVDEDGVVLATTSVEDNETNKSVVKAFNCFQGMTTRATNLTNSDLSALDTTELSDCIIYNELFTVDKLSPYYLAQMGMSSDYRTTCDQRLRDYEGGSDTVVVEDFEGMYDHYLNMSDSALADLPATSNSTAVVPISQLSANTTKEVIDEVASGDLRNSLTTSDTRFTTKRDSTTFTSSWTRWN